jgi:hypothetical protein
MFKFKLDDVHCKVEFAHATQDIDVPGRLVGKGTVAGIMAKWLGISAGLPVIEATVQWSVSDDIAPAWDVAMAYLIEINGTPQVKMRVEVLPEDLSRPMEELMTIGFMLPAIPVVNAIPAVVAAPPGIVTYADLPQITSILRPKLVKNRPSAEPSAAAAEPVRAVERQQDTGPVTIEGRWKITVKGPTGPQVTELLIERAGGELTGTQSAQGVSSPITDVSMEGNRIRWVNHVTKPMKLKVDFSGVLEGTTMTGKCKAGFLGSYDFVGTKAY